MDRRRFLLTSLAGALAAPLATEAQQAAKVARIGYLSADRAASTRLNEAFRRGLHGNDQGARGCSDCVGRQHVLQ